jgi:hypothetical protein
MTLSSLLEQFQIVNRGFVSLCAGGVFLLRASRFPNSFVAVLLIVREKKRKHLYQHCSLD